MQERGGRLERWHVGVGGRGGGRRGWDWRGRCCMKKVVVKGVYSSLYSIYMIVV